MKLSIITLALSTLFAHSASAAYSCAGSENRNTFSIAMKSPKSEIATITFNGNSYEADCVLTRGNSNTCVAAPANQALGAVLSLSQPTGTFTAYTNMDSDNSSPTAEGRLKCTQF